MPSNDSIGGEGVAAGFSLRVSYESSESNINNGHGRAI